MTTNTQVMESKTVSGPSLASLIPLDQLHEAGAYVCSWNGHLIRIPWESLANGTLNFSIVGSEPLFVTKISNDPFVTLSQARVLACNYDVNVNF